MVTRSFSSPGNKIRTRFAPFATGLKGLKMELSIESIEKWWSRSITLIIRTLRSGAFSLQRKAPSSLQYSVITISRVKRFRRSIGNVNLGKEWDVMRNYLWSEFYSKTNCKLTLRCFNHQSRGLRDLVNIKPIQEGFEEFQIYPAPCVIKIEGYKWFS